MTRYLEGTGQPEDVQLRQNLWNSLNNGGDAVIRATSRSPKVFATLPNAVVFIIPPSRTYSAPPPIRDLRGRKRYISHCIDTWASQTLHANGITWFPSKLHSQANVGNRKTQEQCRTEWVPLGKDLHETPYASGYHLHGKPACLQPDVPGDDYAGGKNDTENN